MNYGALIGRLKATKNILVDTTDNLPMTTEDILWKKGDRCSKNPDFFPEKGCLKILELLIQHISVIFVKYLSRIQQMNVHIMFMKSN